MILFRNGNVYESKVSAPGVNFIKLEYMSPDSLDLIEDLSQWTLKINQDIIPKWFCEDVNEVWVFSKLKEYVKPRIIKEKKDFLCGGSYVLLNGADIDTACDCVIKCMFGNSRIGGIYNSEVDKMFDKSKIRALIDNSIINEMHNNSYVGQCINTKVNKVYDDAVVQTMCY
jgi:hypothetical protein